MKNIFKNDTRYSTYYFAITLSSFVLPLLIFILNAIFENKSISETPSFLSRDVLIGINTVSQFLFISAFTLFVINYKMSRWLIGLIPFYAFILVKLSVEIFTTFQHVNVDSPEFSLNIFTTVFAALFIIISPFIYFGITALIKLFKFKEFITYIVSSSIFVLAQNGVVYVDKILRIINSVSNNNEKIDSIIINGVVITLISIAMIVVQYFSIKKYILYVENKSLTSSNSLTLK